LCRRFAAAFRRRWCLPSVFHPGGGTENHFKGFSKMECVTLKISDFSGSYGFFLLPPLQRQRVVQNDGLKRLVREL
jgi:hypothetical protein